MSELIFIAKVFVLTAICVVLLQIKVGENTLEQKALGWAQASPAIAPLQEVTDGGLKVIREVWQRTLGSINSKFLNRIDDKNKPGHRSLGIDLERSKEYLREKAQRAKALAEEQAQRGAEKLNGYINDEESGANH